METRTPQAVLLLLKNLPGVGKRTINRFCMEPLRSIPENGFPDDPRRLAAQITEWLTPAGVRPAGAEFAAADAAAGRILDWLSAHPDVEALTSLDARYPEKLRDLGADQPPLLYVRRKDTASSRGSGVRFSADSTAVIGSRWPEDRTFRESPALLEALVRETGTVIVSGLARGCDAVGHRAAIAAGGRTVAVLASGIDIITPAMHADLAEEILRTGGFLMSEYDPGTEAAEFRYAERDRLTAALSDRILVLECKIRSGTMQTVKAGAVLGRSLGCMYPADGSEAAEGNRYMREQYDAAVIRSREDLLRWTASSGRAAGEDRARQDGSVTADLNSGPDAPPAEQLTLVL